MMPHQAPKSISDLPTAKVDCLMPLSRGPLVPVVANGITICFINIMFTSLVADERMDGRTG